MKFLILGAGPAGLTFANRLMQLGETDFLVLEREAQAGGLCRSVEVDGAPFDIGGGHFLDVQNPHVNRFLFEFMPEEEWNKFERDSRIVVNDNEVSHPIEANIWQMKLEDQVEYLKSIAAAGCNIGEKEPKEFVKWIYWKLGNKIADDYMIPYNQKIFGKQLDKLGTYWLEKLPNVSFEETILACLTKKAHGKQAGHAQFYYPQKYGYGELWTRMADVLGPNIRYNQDIKGIDFDTRTVKVSDGSEYQADFIVTTIPWLEFERITGMPDKIQESIKKLMYSSIQTEYHADCLETKAQWIYYPDKELTYHRILVRKNFFANSRGYWTETNGTRVVKENKSDNFRYMNQYAYPLNTIGKPEIMKNLLHWAETKSVFGLGRWGEHQHYNSDVTVGLAMDLVDKIYREKM